LTRECYGAVVVDVALGIHRDDFRTAYQCVHRCLWCIQNAGLPTTEKLLKFHAPGN
jgi:hypothetical protein